jgi:hypothetical protein
MHFVHMVVHIFHVIFRINTHYVPKQMLTNLLSHDVFHEVETEFENIIYLNFKLQKSNNIT